jgi:Lsr2
MAKETFTKLTDDIDGTEASEELTFALRGIEYEIDLNAKNVAALEKALDKFVKAGRKVSRTRGPRGPVRRAGGRSSKEDLSAIRGWARANGYEVSNRGRISGAIREAYESASL